MTNRGRFLSLAISLVICLTSHISFANQTQFNAIFFQPALGRNPYLMLNSTQTLHKFQFNFGDFTSYAYHPLEIRQGSARVQGVIDNLVVTDIVAAFGILEWLQLGVDLPVVLINKFKDPLTSTAATPTKNHFNLSDLRFELKARVLTTCKYPIGLAFIPFMTVPTGSKTHYVGDSGITGGAKVALDGRVHNRVNLTLNVGAQAGKKILVRNIDYQYRFLFGGGIDIMLPHNLDVFAEVNGQTAFNKFFNDRDMAPTEAMGGVRWDVKETGLSLSAGGGSCLVCGTKGAKIRAVIGANYRYNPEKYKELDKKDVNQCLAYFGKGGMSVVDFNGLRMNCPDDPANYQSGVNDTACPKFYELRELADLVLSCPSKADEFDPTKYDPACPKVFTLADVYSPNDVRNVYALAVAEMSTLCPADPSGFNPAIHDMGCPKYYELKDVITLASVCPAVSAEYNPAVNDAACPKFYTLKDNYTEGQWSAITLITQDDVNMVAQAGISEGEIKTIQVVYFDFGSARLKPEAHRSVDKVIGVINKNPWIRTIKIAGYADSVGSAKANMHISLERSKNVIRYMESHGVREGIDLVPLAYGAKDPAASNVTAKGRALNRRAMFIINKGIRHYDAL